METDPHPAALIGNFALNPDTHKDVLCEGTPGMGSLECDEGCVSSGGCLTLAVKMQKTDSPYPETDFPKISVLVPLLMRRGGSFRGFQGEKEDRCALCFACYGV